MKKEGFSMMKGMIALSAIIAIAAIAIILSAQANAATLCNPANLSCGQPITTPGYGAVELCQTCYTCGVYDGVCPEDFSNGSIETDYNKTRMLIRVGIDRPQMLTEARANPLIYSTGEQACRAVNGTCTRIEGKNLILDPWINTAIGCNTDITSTPQYLRAVCSTPKTAGCQYCTDPDCTSNIRGIVFDETTNVTLNAKVNIISKINWNFRAQTTSDAGGLFNFQAPRGNVRIICTVQDYAAFEKDVFIQKGNNIVDCKMNEAACSPDCTLPDINEQPICRARCDLQNGCQFFSNQTKEICDGVPYGAIVTINRTNSNYVLGVQCCEGQMVQIYRPLMTLDSNNIPNLLTRDYRKKLNGVPVTLRIITYTKD